VADFFHKLPFANGRLTGIRWKASAPGLAEPACQQSWLVSVQSREGVVSLLHHQV